ncbi:MAG: hypothetical protein IJD37_04640 [Clostridia bacterium]|nr:hypothetical protein [Clostridia bacterium]
MKLNIKEIAIFGMLGGLMFASKLAMEVFPNIHLIGVFIVAITVVYRVKALYPIYIFVFVFGLFYGFNIWWLPYLYIWTVLWGIVMLLPKNMPPKVAPIVYMIVCGLHGFLYGTLYAPAQAIMFGFTFKQTVAWIIAGIPFDAIHGVSNLICGMLIVPLIKAMRLADRYTR